MHDLIILDLEGNFKGFGSQVMDLDGIFLLLDEECDIGVVEVNYFASLCFYGLFCLLVMAIIDFACLLLCLLCYCIIL